MIKLEEVSIKTTTINLDQFLKWAGIIDTGGQVKSLVDAEMILVNNNIVTERRKKLKYGDVVEIRGSGLWKVTGP